MKTILFLIPYFLFLIPYSSIAHPGIGIVRDSRGNIFYTDLKQVWKRSPDGKLAIAVPDVHTHELSLDADDNLYGEHLWYNGEKKDTWGHYVWCLKNDGTLINQTGPQEGFLEDYGFLRDSAGNMYWIERFTMTRFKKRAVDGRVTTIAEKKFGNIRWSHVSKNGTLYFVDLHKLYKLAPDGEFTLLASELDDGKKAFGFSRQHNVYGIWTDAADNIYVAIMPAKKVKRITPDGKVDVVAYTRGVWSPASGLFDEKGDLWLLEYGDFGKCRVRKIAAEELTAKPNIHLPVYGNYLLLAAGFVILLLLVFITWKKVKFFRRRRLVSIVGI